MSNTSSTTEFSTPGPSGHPQDDPLFIDCNDTPRIKSEIKEEPVEQPELEDILVDNQETTGLDDLYAKQEEISIAEESNPGKSTPGQTGGIKVVQESSLQAKQNVGGRILRTIDPKRVVVKTIVKGKMTSADIKKKIIGQRPVGSPSVPQNVQQSVPQAVPQPSGPSPEVCLKWGQHQSNIQTTFPSFLNSEDFVDVTLACEGKSVKCHKVILSSCSEYLSSLLRENPCQHPIILMKDLKFWEIEALVKFMYKGEVNIPSDKLPELLKAAEALQVKGLSNFAPGENSPIPMVPTLTLQTGKPSSGAPAKPPELRTPKPPELRAPKPPEMRAPKPPEHKAPKPSSEPPQMSEAARNRAIKRLMETHSPKPPRNVTRRAIKRLLEEQSSMAPSKHRKNQERPHVLPPFVTLSQKIIAESMNMNKDTSGSNFNPSTPEFNNFDRLNDNDDPDDEEYPEPDDDDDDDYPEPDDDEEDEDDDDDENETSEPRDIYRVPWWAKAARYEG